MALGQFRSEKIPTTHKYYPLGILLIFLIGLSLAFLYSISYRTSLRLYGVPTRIFVKQLIYYAVFALWTFFLSRVKPEVVRKVIPYLLIATILLLILPLIPKIGLEIKGGRRWVNLGPLGTFQPSELAKVTIILFLSHKLDQIKNTDKITTGFSSIITILLLFFFVILMQKDNSTVFILAFVSLLMLFVGDMPILKMLILLAFIGIVFALFCISSEYAKARIISFFSPTIDLNENYQIARSLTCYATCGVLGKGLGTCMEGLALPEAHCDFILPAIASEVGLLGLVGIISLFVLLGVYGYRIAFSLRSQTYYSLVAFGLTTFLVAQFFLNLAITVKLFPTTGLPVPFFSAGGSSLFASLTMVGLLLALSNLKTEGQVDR